MKTLTIGAIVLAGWLGAGAYWHTCQIKCLCGDQAAVIAPPPADAPPASPDETPDPPTDTPAASGADRWAATENDVDVFVFSTGPTFDPGDATLMLSDKNSGMLDSIYDFLNRNPDHEVWLRGQYAPAEGDSTLGDSLGMARATALADMLVNHGVNPDRIETGSHALPEGRTPGLEVRFKKLEGEMVTKVDSGISHKTLHCLFGVAVFRSDPTLVAYTEELRDYLDRHSGETVELIGHTDNIGPADANVRLGKRRARAVMRYFKSKGIPGDRMKVSSKGEAEPIASNGDKEGRAQNRRIEVRIQ